VPKLVTLIETYETRGDGTSENPFRLVKQLFTIDGRLVVEQMTAYDKEPQIFLEVLSESLSK